MSFLHNRVHVLSSFMYVAMMSIAVTERTEIEQSTMGDAIMAK